MRTTVNIDDHLLEEAKILAARGHRTVSDVLEDALRRLIAWDSSEGFRLPVELPVSGSGKGRMLVDIDDKEALAEALGDNEWPRADS